MTQYRFETATNTKRESRYDVTGQLMPTQAFFFVVTEEPGRDGFLARRVYSSVNDPNLLRKKLTPEQRAREVYPEQHGLTPKRWDSKVTVAEHVYGDNLSSYLSASTILPGGAPRFVGRDVYIDIRKAKKAGAAIVETHEIIQALEDYKTKFPGRTDRIDRVAGWVRDLDKEVLIKAKHVSASGIFTRESLRVALKLSMYVRVVQVFGIGFTAYDLYAAGEESFETYRAKPLEKEVIRQAGGWGAGMAGARIGMAVGATLGLETGPGVVITGAIGGIIFGSIGYFGGSVVADRLGN